MSGGRYQSTSSGPVLSRYANLPGSVDTMTDNNDITSDDIASGAHVNASEIDKLIIPPQLSSPVTEMRTTKKSISLRISEKLSFMGRTGSLNSRDSNNTSQTIPGSDDGKPPLQRRRSSRRLGKKQVAAKSRMPPNSAWRQQRLPSYMYIPTPNTFIPTMAGVAALFVLIGGLIIGAGRGTQSYSQDYTLCQSVNGLVDAKGDPALCKDLTNNIEQPCLCQVDITVDEDMTYPVNLFYGMEGFYQNHRRYIRNRFDATYRYKQNLFLAQGNSRSRCTEPNERNGKAIAPCGAIARSFFNDTMTLWSNNSAVPLSAKGIAISGDSLAKYRNPVPKNDLETAFADTIRPINWQFMGAEDISVSTFGDEDVGYGFENQDWMVWMRVAALPNFKKLYRKVVKPFAEDTVFRAGKYSVRIVYNYPATEMGATKQVHLQETSRLGGKATNIGIIYLCTGCVLGAIAIALFVLHYTKGRAMGDQTFLSSIG